MKLMSIGPLQQSEAARSIMLPKAVVVHAGARDNYEVAKALNEIGALECLVTNVYAPFLTRDRNTDSLPIGSVRISPKALLAYCAMRAWPKLSLHAYSDQCMGEKARAVACYHKAALLSYSYYAGAAFAPQTRRPNQRFLFQFHPHVRAVRQLLLEELERVPEAAQSLSREAELVLTGEKAELLEQEAQLANGWLAASSYTASTLIEAGIDKRQIHVVPYGVDGSVYSLRSAPPSFNYPFTLYFLGTISQRKGLSYLLEAMSLLKTKSIRLLLRGRGAVDWNLLARYKHLNVDIQVGMPTSSIVAELHQADLFVLPSLTEGFGHSILQAMSCGVPVVTTRNTCGADLISSGQNGFLVPIRDSEALASVIEQAVLGRDTIYQMGMTGAQRAQELTWTRFRQGIQSAYGQMCMHSMSAASSHEAPACLG